VPVLYPASLLYMVSGLFEEPVIDEPLLGMERYYHVDGPYDLPQVHDILDWIDGHCVWSASAGGAGLGSGALRHGGFAADPQTLASLEHILTHGF
jgi:hypothetical protein